jgi:hypothetical protein
LATLKTESRQQTALDVEGSEKVVDLDLVAGDKPNLLVFDEGREYASMLDELPLGG